VDAAVRLALQGDLDLPFLHALILAQEQAFEHEETSGWTLASMVDHVLVREGKRQRFGTHCVWRNGGYAPSPIEDEETVDARRARLGLGTMAEWNEVVKRWPPPASP
jgi:hypothetical protein